MERISAGERYLEIQEYTTQDTNDHICHNYRAAFNSYTIPQPDQGTSDNYQNHSRAQITYTLRLPGFDDLRHKSYTGEKRTQVTNKIGEVGWFVGSITHNNQKSKVKSQKQLMNLSRVAA